MIKDLLCFACYYNPPKNGIVQKAVTMAGGAALCEYHLYLVGPSFITSNTVLNHPATIEDWEKG